MRAEDSKVMEVLSRYAAGYFPLYDLKGKFYWERLAVRAVIPVEAGVVARARRMGKRAAGRFEIRYTTAVEEVIEQLRREEVKERSWVKEEVVKIYRGLHGAGLLQTVEAWEVGGKSKSIKGKSAKGEGSGRLVGGLLGLVVPGTFIAETMFGLVPEASKVCLCRLVEDCAAQGFEMIDVQTPHDLDEFGVPRTLAGATAHPCVRLGEEHLTIATFMRAFVRAWKRAFEGGVEEWLAAAREVREAGREGELREDLAAARRLLAFTVPGGAEGGGREGGGTLR